MKKKLTIVLLSAALMLVLAACAETAALSQQIDSLSELVGPIPTVTATPTAKPKESYIPKVTPSPSPTAKPFYYFAPSTPTPPVSPEPSPSATPSPTPRPTVTPYVPPTVPPVVKMPGSVSFQVDVATPKPVETAPPAAPEPAENNAQPQPEENNTQPPPAPQPTEAPQPEPTSKPAPAPAPSGPSGQEVANYACGFVGYNYVYGGTSPETGFDCSGFVYYVYSQFGYTLHRIAADQAYDGVGVSASELQPGDVLCFYNSGSYIGHSGIYIGGGQYVHAESSATGVVISSLASRTYSYECRRIIH